VDNIKFPVVSRELLEELEKRFPDRMPENPIDQDQYILRQGRVEVVRFLRHQFNLQNQNILEN
jgi:hypothetical protein